MPAERKRLVKALVLVVGIRIGLSVMPPPLSVTFCEVEGLKRAVAR